MTPVRRQTTTYCINLSLTEAHLENLGVMGNALDPITWAWDEMVKREPVPSSASATRFSTAGRAMSHNQRSLRRPSIFLVGAPKTGTTAMSIYLGRHPEIFMARKELHYFSQEAFYPPRLEERDLAWYLNEFREAGDKTLLGEASVWYLSSDIAAQRIKEFEPHAKILILVRNPADLIVSYNSELLFRGYEDIEDIEQALDAE